MDLKEFDLDLPYVANDEKIKSIMKDEKCQYNDAIKIDYNSNWKANRRLFRLQTRCVTAMYERLFGKMKTEDCWKILVECVEDITEERILNFSGVVTVQVKLSFVEFSFLSGIEKKRTTLNLLMKGIEKISSNKSWAVEPFREVSSQIEQMGYSNEWVWKKAVNSPDKNYYAEILCQYNINSMDISILIWQKNGVLIKRGIVISELPDEFAYAKHVGELKWISDVEVALINKNGDNRVSIKLNSHE